MIQADPLLLRRARRSAHERGMSFPEFVRTALEHELRAYGQRSERPSCVGVISTDGQARKRSYEPDAWR